MLTSGRRASYKEDAVYPSKAGLVRAIMPCWSRGGSAGGQLLGREMGAEEIPRMEEKARWPRLGQPRGIMRRRWRKAAMGKDPHYRWAA